MCNSQCKASRTALESCSVQMNKHHTRCPLQHRTHVHTQTHVYIPIVFAIKSDTRNCHSRCCWCGGGEKGLCAATWLLLFYAKPIWNTYIAGQSSAYVYANTYRVYSIRTYIKSARQLSHTTHSRYRTLLLCGSFFALKRHI